MPTGAEPSLTADVLGYRSHMVDGTSSGRSTPAPIDPLDPGVDYEPYEDLVTGRGDNDVEADYVDQGLSGVAGMELNQYSPMGEVGVVGQMARSSAARQPGWRRNVIIGLILAPIVAAVAAGVATAVL